MIFNIRRGLILFTFSLVVVTGVCTYFYAENQVKRTITNQIEKKLSASSYYFMNSLDAYMYERIQDVKTLTHARLKQDSTLNKSELISFLNSQVIDNLNFDSFYILNEKKNIIAQSSVHSPNAVLPLDELHNHSQLDEIILDYLFNDKGEIIKLIIGHRYVIGAKKQMLVGTLPVHNIYKIIKNDFSNLSLKDHFHVELFDQNGLSLYSNAQNKKQTHLSPFKLKRIVNLIYNPKNALTNEFYEDSSEVYFIGQEKGYMEFKGNGWFIILSMPIEEAYLPIQRLNESIVTVFLIVLLLAAIATAFLTKFFTVPITKLETLASEYAQENFSHRIELKTKNEFQKLAQQMTSMANQIQVKMSELKKVNTQLEHKFREVDLQNQEINAAIRYAQHIQKALLPGERRLKKYSKTTSVFYQPSKIVSGDYYFLHEFSKEGTDYYAAAVVDCTGHGVPGAFMTIIAHHLLVYLISIKKLTSPAKILEELDRGVKRNLQNGADNSVTDGMELSLVIINKNTNEVHFSGAKRPIYIKQQNEWLLIKGSKRSICAQSNTETDLIFEEHTFQLNTNDLIYMYTDGITDQFGGSSDKKIGRARLHRWIQETDSSNKLQEVVASIKNWQKNEKQIDDMTLMQIDL